MSGYIKLPVNGTNDASGIKFDPTGTDLTSTTVEDAIKEVYNSSVSSSKYILNFTTGSWIDNGGFYEIEVLASIHNKGTSPNCKTYELISAIYHLNITSVMMDSLGNITLQVTKIPDNRYSGKLTIE